MIQTTLGPTNKGKRWKRWIAEEKGPFHRLLLFWLQSKSLFTSLVCWSSSWYNGAMVRTHTHTHTTLFFCIHSSISFAFYSLFVSILFLFHSMPHSIRFRYDYGRFQWPFTLEQGIISCIACMTIYSKENFVSCYTNYLYLVRVFNTSDRFLNHIRPLYLPAR